MFLYLPYRVSIHQKYYEFMNIYINVYLVTIFKLFYNFIYVKKAIKNTLFKLKNI